jgi:hypothetical protein
MTTTYRDMVCPLSIRGDGDGDARDAEEHENQRPPGEVGEATMDGGYYRADKGDDPGENANRYGGKRKGISDDATQAKARRSLAVASVFHFAQ